GGRDRVDGAVVDRGRPVGHLCPAARLRGIRGLDFLRADGGEPLRLSSAGPRSLSWSSPPVPLSAFRSSPPVPLSAWRRGGTNSRDRFPGARLSLDAGAVRARSGVRGGELDRGESAQRVDRDGAAGPRRTGLPCRTTQPS